MRAFLICMIVPVAACATRPMCVLTRPEPVTAAPPAAVPGPPAPVARIRSTDGHARLDVAYACVAEADTNRPRRVVLKAEASADDDVVVAHGATARSRLLLDGTPVDGASVAPSGPGSRQDLSVEFPVGGGPVSLAGLAVEVPLLHVSVWTEYAVTVSGTAPADTREVAAPPWRLRCGFDGELGAVTVSIGNAGERAPLTGLLTHGWAMESITVTDGTSDGFDFGAGGGVGGSSYMRFGRMSGPRPVPPFTVRLRVPATWTLEAVTFPLDEVVPVPLPR